MSVRELLVLVAMCLVWGFHFIVIKLAVAEIPPIFYAAIRMTLVAILMSPFLRWRRGEMAPVLVAGICLGAINYALMFNGVKFGTASSAAIAMELYVPFATILSIIFLHEKIGVPRILGIAFAFAGVALIALGKPADVGPDTRIALGIAFVAAGAFSEAVGAILIKKSPGFKAHQLLAWFAVMGTISLWSFTAIFETDQLPALAKTNHLLIAFAILYSAIGGSIFGHTAYYWLLQRLPISVVAPSVLLTTFFAVVFGIVLLDEPFSLRMVIGGLMVIAGVGVVILRNTKKQDIKTPVSPAEV